MGELSRLTTVGVLAMGMSPALAIAESIQVSWSGLPEEEVPPVCQEQGGCHALGLAASANPATAVVETSVGSDTLHTPEFSRRTPKAESSGSPRTATLSPPPKAPTTPSPSLRPSSGSQLYHQRWAALRTGSIYTRLPADSFKEAWSNINQQISYEQWVTLLRQEASAIARGQGNNRLSVILGDSLSLWLPPDQLPRDGLWLNQSISGDTTTGVLRRLSAFANTRPDTIHLMIGINDLRRGRTDAELLNNLYEIVTQLRRNHPQAQIIVYSLLPTRLPALPPARIQRLNLAIEAIALYTQSRFMNLHTQFSDATGILQRHLTTDGLHLSRRGYGVWQQALREIYDI